MTSFDRWAALAALPGWHVDSTARLEIAAASLAMHDVSSVVESLLQTIHQEQLGPTEMNALCLEDLVLAKAALVDARALQKAADILQRAAASALARMRMPDALRQDLVQQVHIKVLLPPEQKLASYAGRAQLTTWLRTVATREGLSQLRKRGELPGDEAVLRRLPAAEDADAEFLMRRYGDEFRAAFAEAMLAVDDGERLLLRQYYVDGLTVEDLGALAGVHKSTISRRLEAARSRLSAKLRAAFAMRVPASESQVQSIVRGLQSQLDLSLSRLTR